MSVDRLDHRGTPARDAVDVAKAHHVDQPVTDRRSWCAVRGYLALTKPRVTGLC